MIKDGVIIFIEIGFGNVLQGLVKKVDIIMFIEKGIFYVGL